MSRLYVDGTAALPLHSIGEPCPPPQLRLVPAAASGGRLREVRRGPMRLTQRGLLVVAVVLGLLAATVFMGLGLFSPATSSGHSVGEQGVGAPVGATLVVQPGDSLWSIATRIAPGVDPRLTVQQLVDRNGLSGTAVVAGQVLRLP